MDPAGVLVQWRHQRLPLRLVAHSDILAEDGLGARARHSAHERLARSDLLAVDARAVRRCARLRVEDRVVNLEKDLRAQPAEGALAVSTAGFFISKTPSGFPFPPPERTIYLNKGRQMALHNDVFREQVWEFFCNDIESCLEVSREVQNSRADNTRSKFKGGLNFTAATAIFAVIDFCSGFNKGSEASSNDVALFMSEYFKSYDTLFENLELSKQFYNVFRNGLSHQWSPKASGVSMDFNNDHVVVFVGSEYVPSLNVPSFYNVVVNGLKDFESRLDQDQLAAERFSRRYNQLILHDHRIAERFKQLLADRESSL